MRGPPRRVHHRYPAHKKVGRGSQGIAAPLGPRFVGDPPQREVAARQALEHGVEQLARGPRLLRELRPLKTVKRPEHHPAVRLMLLAVDKRPPLKHVYVVYELMPTDLEGLIRSGQTRRGSRALLFRAALLGARVPPSAFGHAPRHQAVEPPRLARLPAQGLRFWPRATVRAAEDQLDAILVCKLGELVQGAEVCAFALARIRQIAQRARTRPH